MPKQATNKERQDISHHGARNDAHKKTSTFKINPESGNLKDSLHRTPIRPEPQEKWTTQLSKTTISSAIIIILKVATISCLLRLFIFCLCIIQNILSGIDRKITGEPFPNNDILSDPFVGFMFGILTAIFAHNSPKMASIVMYTVGRNYTNNMEKAPSIIIGTAFGTLVTINFVSFLRSNSCAEFPRTLLTCFKHNMYNWLIASMVFLPIEVLIGYLQCVQKSCCSDANKQLFNAANCDNQAGWSKEHRKEPDISRCMVSFKQFGFDNNLAIYLNYKILVAVSLATMATCIFLIKKLLNFTGSYNPKGAVNAIFLHIFVHWSGILLFYPHPLTKLPFVLTREMATYMTNNRLLAIIYITMALYGFPELISSLSTPGTTTYFGIMTSIVIILVTIVVISVFQKMRPSVPQ